jgi:DnaB-like helicase N terminal domain
LLGSRSQVSWLVGAIRRQVAWNVTPPGYHLTNTDGWGCAVSVSDDVRAPGLAGSGPTPSDRSGDAGYDRTPPQDIAAEQCVLGGMLLSKDAIADVVEILRSGDF